VKTVLHTALLLLSVIMLAGPVLAQSGATSDILRGRVTDGDGQAVVGARVQARDLESGLQRSASTNQEGRYTLVFPEGGGRYELAISFPTMTPVRVLVERQGDEEVLITHVQLRPGTVALAPVVVRAEHHGTPGRAEAGSREQSLSGELTERLPIDNLDPATIASLSPGVFAVPGADSLGGGGFSVAGQRTTQNQVTLDGATFAALLSGSQPGGSGLGVPQEGVRGTRVLTSTYDIARGQFAGGQVETTTRSGTNTFRGSATYQLRDDRLDGGAGRTPWSDGYTQQRVSGGLGGPIVRDRLFYYWSFTGQRRVDHAFSLRPRDPAGFTGIGVSPDSVARFIEIAEGRYGIPMRDQTGDFVRTGSALSMLGRLDYILPSHTLTVRGFGSWSVQNGAFIRTLDARQHGGEISGAGWAGVATLTSQFGPGWINELRISAAVDERSLSASSTLPEARVRVASTGVEGTVESAILSIGGDPIFPSETREHTLEIANEVSWLWGDAHRVKGGILVQRFDFDVENSANRSGSFSFASVADFEAGRPASFTRYLSPQAARGGGWNAAVYAGDAWRPTAPLQVTYGARLESSGYDQPSRENLAADSLFGLATGRAPLELRLSPRLGFSWRLNRRGTPLKLLRGGLGEFRGRVPAGLYADALAVNGPDGQAFLACVGDGEAPDPDFLGFAADPASIPTVCAGAGGGEAVSGAIPSAVGFAPGFRAPRSQRASLGFQAQFWRLLGGSVDVTYARGVDLYRVEDLNLRDAPAFRLSEEAGRPVFVDATAVDPRTGEMSLLASRVDARFAHAFRLLSDTESETRQLTLTLNGVVPATRLSFQASYTLASSRDQSSFSFGGARQGFFATPTPGSPNLLSWAPSDLDRRHSVIAVAGLSLGAGAEMSLIARTASGIPFTPRVGSDINGDGARNDVAFIFDPARTADPTVAAGMDRLLAHTPRSVRECLRAQLGQLALRNSCRTGWSHAFDLRAALRPRVGARRVSIGIEAYNLGAGLDLVLHGRAGLRGWGHGGRGVDPVLLYPRAFDSQTGTFRYQVNETFGQARFSRLTEGAPFTVQISTRIALGPRPRTDPLGGFADLGTPGIASGALTRISVTGAAGGTGPDAISGSALDDADEPGHGPGPARLIARLLPEPLSDILALSDSLDLSPQQVVQLEAVRDSLRVRNGPIHAEVSRVFNAAFMGQGDVVEPDELFATIGPMVNEGRQNVQAALDDARRVLTPEQWELVPESIRKAVASQGLQLMNAPP
jgi:hypothetical protein